MSASTGPNGTGGMTQSAPALTTQTSAAPTSNGKGSFSYGQGGSGLGKGSQPAASSQSITSGQPIAAGQQGDFQGGGWSFASGGRVGPLTGATGGRADKLPMKVPNGSHVIPADVVSALGQGNSQHGHKVLSRMFPHSAPRAQSHPGSPSSGLRKRGGEVPVMVSDGEFIVSPEDVRHRGGGDQEHGHRVLDHFIVHTRKQNINHLKNLPGPARD